MANRIKGITVEINGDTTKLSKALEGVNKNIRNTQTQLKDVEKLLKLDPTNTELLSQKQKLLADAVSSTKEKLETLKTAAKQANTALANGDITQEQYDALQREIIETEHELQSLEQQAKQSGTALTQMAQTGEKLKTVGTNISNAGQALLPLTGMIVGLGTAAVKTGMDFDAAMSKVSSVSGATGEELQSLRDKAREMGSKTKFSASEAAEAMNYMAMAGWKTTDMLSGIDGVMNLAAASGEDLATTSDIVTDALTAFGLTAADSGHFADVLAAASSNANTNVSMMGETFKYAAPQIIQTALQLIVTLVQGLMDNLPQIIQAALNLVLALIQGIVDNLPMIIETAINLIITIVGTIIDNLPMIIDAAIQIIIALVEGLVSAIPQILSAVWEIVKSIISEFLSGDWIGTGIDILTSLIDGIVSMVSSVLSSIGDLIGQIFDKFLDLGSDMLDVGKNIVEGLWDGISGAAGWLWDKISEFCSEIWDGICDFFEIASPSKLFKRELGFNLVYGLAEGIDGKAETAVNAVNSMGNDVMKAAEKSLQADWNLSGFRNVPSSNSVVNNYYNNDNSRTVNQTNNSPKALSRLEIYRLTRNAVNT